jgi:hypothetical protein
MKGNTGGHVNGYAQLAALTSVIFNPTSTSGVMHAKSASCISVEGLSNNNVIRGLPDFHPIHLAASRNALEAR